MRIPILLCAAISLSGCGISVGTGQLRDPEAVGRIQVGISRAEAEDALGPPCMALPLEEGREVWVWTHEAGTIRAASFLPLLDLLAGGYDIDSVALSVLWGPEGRAIRVSPSSWTGGRGGTQDHAGEKARIAEAEEEPLSPAWGM